MRIDCPICGPRMLEEFFLYGDATRRRPDADAPIETWVDYVYLRDNPAGAHTEYWFHGVGCRTWLKIERDTVTHAIHSVSPAEGTAR
ncbi:MAG: sarcosine oxidase subunit delta [Novosphingobium sp.]|jgi:sarcosine oxidase subunit delta|uniref:sarcosine oxidase subunit delta n=1 Tax=Novosphingobium sp. TaxID=1874826 RepID=UPI00301A9178